MYTLFLSLFLMGAPMNSENPLQADLNKTVSVKIGQRLAFNELDDQILFSGVSEDSRCPEGTHCMWAGRARVQLTYKGNTIDLDIPGMQQEVDVNKTHDGLIFTATKLAPYPQAGNSIKAGDYILHLSVKKA